MRKGNKNRKFSRKKDARKALLKALMTNLILKEKIKTTEAKAKEIRRYIEKVVTRAKKNNLTSVKLLRKKFSENTVRKLIKEIAPLYKERKGGYTRITKLGPRFADGAEMALIEFIK